MDITLYVCVVLDTVFMDRVVYVGLGISDDLLKAIRGDEGVLFVECDYMVYVADKLGTYVGWDSRVVGL